MIDFTLELRKEKSPESLQFKDLPKPSQEELVEIWQEIGREMPKHLVTQG